MADRKNEEVHFPEEPSNYAGLENEWHSDPMQLTHKDTTRFLDGLFGQSQLELHNTQGILDDGSDMVIRVPPLEDDKLSKLICLQAKSLNDLAKDSYMQEPESAERRHVPQGLGP
jgi:hypothetical protein